MRYLVLLFYFLISPVYAATVTFDNGFESGTLSGFSCSGNCFTVSGASKLNGNYGGDFVLTRNMATPYRTEAVLGNAGKFNFNSEYWIGYNHNFADWAKDSDGDMALQTHPTYNDWSLTSTCLVGSGQSGDSFHFFTQNDVLKFGVWTGLNGGGNYKWQQPLKHNIWQSIVLHFIPSGGSNGLIELWVDNVKVASHTGQNAYVTPPNCPNAQMGPISLKLGIYKWNWKDGRPATQSTRRQIYIDNVKIASGANGYAQVYTPTGTPSADTTPPVLSNISSTSTASSCTVTWTTNEGATSKVDYGLTTGYGSVSSGTLFVTSHSRLLSNLTQNTTYHYKVTSIDAAGNSASSADRTCVTPPTDVTPPVISNITVTNITTTGATINWTTNESSDSRVDYGLTTGYGSNETDAANVTSHSLILTGLTQSTTYQFKVTSKDPTGNSSVSSNQSFTTATPDTTAPILSNVATSNITSTGATITWTTDESSDSRVDYGLTTSYGSNKSNATMVTIHSITLGNLTPGTLYNYKASSKDATGNNGTGVNVTFTTIDTEAPVITNVAASGITPTTATITWTTNEAADGLVDYGLSNSYGSTKSHTTFLTSHSVSLTGLMPGTQYNYRITSKDTSNNTTVDINKTFTTTIPADETAPSISGVNAVNLTNNTATIVWVTDEDSDSLVEYGTTISYGSNKPDFAFVQKHSVTMSDLLKNTTYHYRVKSKDSAGNTETSTSFLFTTRNDDTTAPNISNIVVIPNENDVTITWDTDELSDSSINYGLTTSYGSNKLDSSMVTRHNLSITGLVAKTTYNYKIHSKDAFNNTAHSTNLTFTTSDSTSPSVFNVVVTPTVNGATISWETSEDSDGMVTYGTTSSYGSSIADTAMIFSSTVKNESSTDIPAGTTIRVGYLVDDIARAYGSLVTAIAAGQSVTVGTTSEPYTIVPGTHTLKAHADDTNLVVETVENNNQKVISITVSPSVPQ